ncbi:MAG TPA: DUF4198 domain-containing protein [Thermoanaerobaculia bacterium]|jgi:uncharacterized GH25 family protein|nr:DUF4198 domain-containing protein [Thermoanaerobaculia bacterium]
MPLLRAASFAFVGLLAASAVLGHDFWIEPSSFRPAPGARVAIRLRVGEHLKGDPMPRDPARIERFAVVGPSGELAVPGLPGVDPAGWVLPAKPGIHWVVYDSNHASVEQTGPKFDAYLGEEGLERIRQLRRGAGPIKEIYSRCAKSLLQVGKGSSGYDRVLGLELELVPEKNPYALKPGEALPLSLLYHGKPLDGALVIGMASPGAKVSARTVGGRASLVLDRPGLWLVKVVHMVPAPEGSGAEWESLWASLTFELPAL